MNRFLAGYLASAARRWPSRTAIEDPTRGGRITFEELKALSDRLAERLRHMGVRPGDRVGFCLHKSIESIASIYGILEAGAAYVPVDVQAPIRRSAGILADCGVAAVVVEEELAESLGEALAECSHRSPLLAVTPSPGGAALASLLDERQSNDPAAPFDRAAVASDDLAYILYTSGSTGKPKGVMLSHENACSFVDWCVETFEASEEDRFSSHAPLHFDLSILDVHVAMRSGATLVLVSEAVGKDPQRLAALIGEADLTVWYSVPSILGLLAQYGDLESYDLSSLRLVLFAGEVFPVGQLRQLKALIPHATYFNLYGPTETNVCTYLRVPEEVPADRVDPYPIGRACENVLAKVIDEAGDVSEEGELCIFGPTVTSGYWGQPEMTAERFLDDEEGRAWYRTGDIVRPDDAGDYLFLGRRDRMIKKRGFRVELGEIEACLHTHPGLEDVGVVATDGTDGVVVTAFVVPMADQKLSIIALKVFCSERLPLYMIPDQFVTREPLPRTSTGKVDYPTLAGIARE